jgi:hypothetical protein
LVENLFGLTEREVRAEVMDRACAAILGRYPEIQGCVVDEVVREVLGATVEADADDVMRAYMTITGWY